MHDTRRAPSRPTALRAQRTDGGAEDLQEIQRTRLLRAMAEIGAEQGAGNATVGQIVLRAGVSRRTFYELFSDRDDCVSAAFDQAIARIAAVVVPAYRGPARWPERVRAGLAALLEQLDTDRSTARLVVVEALAAGPKTVERRAGVLRYIAEAFDAARVEGKRGAGPSPLTAEGLAGAVLSLIHARLLDPQAGTLVELLNPLMAMIVLPYRGPAAARRELAHRVRRSSEPEAIKADPLRELDMRLTYRTVRALLAIGDHPGASNRAVSDACGIRDQGQISRLLARLERLGLAENREGRPAGEPNAWVLTAQGNRVREAVSSA